MINETQTGRQHDCTVLVSVSMRVVRVHVRAARKFIFCLLIFWVIVTDSRFTCDGLNGRRMFVQVTAGLTVY